MLSKIQGEKEEWSSVIEFKEMMKGKHVKMQKASSWVKSPFGDR